MGDDNGGGRVCVCVNVYVCECIYRVHGTLGLILL